MAKRYSRSLVRVYWPLLLLAAVVGLRIAVLVTSTPVTSPLVEGDYRVIRVVDGDTLVLDGGRRVRLQGIDTPETVRPDFPVEAWGTEATQFTEQFVEQAGGVLRLTFGAERLDRYGRHLAFAWDGERLLNEELVRAGLAEARLDYRFSGTMKRRLAAAQAEAKSAGRGLWSAARQQVEQRP